VGTKALLKGFKKNLPYIAEKMPDMPELIFDVIKRVAEGESETVQSNEIKQLKEKLSRNHQQLSFTVLGATGFIVAAVFLGQPDHQQIFNVPVLSWISAGVGGLCVWLGLKK
jgi:ubiquinone biosynthesis protein